MNVPFLYRIGPKLISQFYEVPDPPTNLTFNTASGKLCKTLL